MERILIEYGENENVTADDKKPPRGKSCEGCLFYSSVLNSNSKSQSPFCVGLSRTLKQVPDYVVSSDSKVLKGNQTLKDFRYARVGYSVHHEKNIHSAEPEKLLIELPFCVIEILSVKKASNPDHAPAHFRKGKEQEDGHTSPLPQSQRRQPMQVPSNGFLYRYTKNAGVAAMGVKRTILLLSNHIKKKMDNALDPYKRRSK